MMRIAGTTLSDLTPGGAPPPSSRADMAVTVDAAIEQARIATPSALPRLCLCLRLRKNAR